MYHSGNKENPVFQFPTNHWTDLANELGGEFAGRCRTHDETDAFVAKWRPRTDDITNARHRTMLQVILGETLEQKRFFDQVAAGNEDSLGRRSNGPGSPGTGNGVMGVRWIE